MPMILRSPLFSRRSWTYILVLSTLSATFVVRATAEDKRYLAPLGDVPDWTLLDPYQRTITREEFEQELAGNYGEYIPPPPEPPEPEVEEEAEAEEGAEATATEESAPEDGEAGPEAATEAATDEAEADAEEVEEVPPPPPPYWAKFIEITDEKARIVTNTRRPTAEYYDLYFAQEASVPVVKRYWRSVEQLPPAKSPDRPLEGMRIVIDPGHIGGVWAQMEERWFVMKPEVIPPEETEGEEGSSEEVPLTPPEVKVDQPVKEGEIVLRVSQILEKKLTSMGAHVAVVRRDLNPVTKKRPKDFYEHVRDVYGYPSDTDPEDNYRLRKTAERLFYLTSEIRARADIINGKFRPDLALCLHVNAESWGKPSDPDFANRNHLHILVNGCYSEGEMLQDDQRFDMLMRLLQRIHGEEVPIADTVAAVMAEQTRLPPFTYLRSNARSVSPSPYVWSRNLLATRQYQCPVVFMEPYVMNHEQVYNRVQAGEYEGFQEFDGIPMVNIYEEYADSVARGVAEYYRGTRTFEAAAE